MSTEYEDNRHITIVQQAVQFQMFWKIKQTENELIFFYGFIFWNIVVLSDFRYTFFLQKKQTGIDSTKMFNDFNKTMNQKWLKNNPKNQNGANR